MQYAQYGKNGPMISRLGYGLMRLPVKKKNDYGSINYTKSTEAIRAALAAGVNFFDSHHLYHEGNSEVAFGKALKGWKGQRVYIQTKTPWYRPEKIDWFKKRLDLALENLNVESIDYLLSHAMEMKFWKKNGKSFIRFTDWALKQGLIQHRGFSSHETPENIKKFIDTGLFDAMLVSYNWMDPRERDVIAYAADKGLGVSVMNPLGGGGLTANTKPVLGLIPGAKTAAEVGFRYVLATPGVVAAVSGMRNPVEVAENVRIASRKVPMTPKQCRTMKTRLGAITRQASKFCSQCGYCMPCPAGVDIPANFRAYQRMKFFGQTELAKWWFRRYRVRKEGDASALACKKCGRCLPKCPNCIPIIDQLVEVAAQLGEETK